MLGQSAAGLQWGPALFRSLLAFHGAVLICLSWFGLQRLDKAEARLANAEHELGELAVTSPSAGVFHFRATRAVIGSSR